MFLVCLLACASCFECAPEQARQDTATEVACMLRDHGVRWLSVQQHARRWLGQEQGPKAVLSGALRFESALREDATIPRTSIELLQTGELTSLCTTGQLTLIFLRCATGGLDSDGCSPEALNERVKWLFGFESFLTVKRILKSGWPVYAMLALVARTLPLGANWKSVEVLLEDLRIQTERVVGGSSPSPDIASSLLQSLRTACPYKEVFSSVVCDHASLEHNSWTPIEHRLASATVELAYAAAHIDFRGDDSVDCEYLGNLCPRVTLNAKAEAKIERALHSVNEAFQEVTSPILLTLIGAVVWPLAEELAWISSLLWKYRDQDIDELRVMSSCNCNLDGWTDVEISSLAASMRIMSRLRNAEGNVDKILFEAKSTDSDFACPFLPPSPGNNPRFSRLLMSYEKAKPLVVSTALRFLILIGVRPIEYSQRVSWEEVDELGHVLDRENTGICFPGALIMAMACAVVGFGRNTYKEAMEVLYAQGILLRVGLHCVLPSSDATLHAKNWEILRTWIADDAFGQMIVRPLLTSTKWWIGDDAGEGWAADPRYVADMMSKRSLVWAKPATPCHGVWDARPNHPCHLMSSSDAIDTELRLGMPRTRVLGVGCIKSGSTVVLQALAAATRLSLGFDCQALGDTAVVQQVIRREVPLESIFNACSHELWAWSLTKDPMLTPLALRLASVWPALSSHGEELRLYFLVRNPFDVVRSVIEHLGLKVRLDPEHSNEQLFHTTNLPLTGRFTRGMQLFLDTTKVGFNYTGYADALVQQWALFADEYLRDRQRYVLVRYEDFEAEPVNSTRNLSQALGLDVHWDPDTIARVQEVSRTQYQTRGKRRGHDFRQVFGPRLYARIRDAVDCRARAFGYTNLLEYDGDENYLGAVPAIEMPPLPEEAVKDLEDFFPLQCMKFMI